MEGFAGTAVQEPVFPHPPQSLGQDVLQDTPEKAAGWFKCMRFRRIPAPNGKPYGR
jgi:hypothetical protein